MPYTAERDVEAESEVTVARSVDLKASPLEQHGQVGRLLELDEEDALADCVRDAGGDKDAVARFDLELVQRLEHALALLALDPVGQLGRVDVLGEAEAHGRPSSARLDDQPRLRLPVGESEVPMCERPIGVGVHRKPLAGVQQLHEQRRFRAVPGSVRWAEEIVGIGEDRVADETPVGQRAQAASVLAEERRR